MTRIVKKKFGELNMQEPLFTSLKEDYLDFPSWFQQKKEEPLYVAYWQEELAGVLYLKIENQVDEMIQPKMTLKKRMKVGTFKVEKEGFGIGTKLLNLVYKRAQKNDVSEVYLTVFEHGMHHQKFIAFIERAGFIHYGYKNKERVYIKTLKNE